MPGGDGTGPLGLGPMTGRKAGYCAGYPVPGFMNPYVPRLGRGFFWRRWAFFGSPYFGFGRGRGFGRGFFWRRWAFYGYPYANPAYTSYSAYAPYDVSNLNPEEEKKLLLEETKILQEQLAEIKKRISELEGKAREKEIE